MNFLFSFCLMMIFWVFLSGKLDLFHLALGVFSSFLVSVWSSDLLFGGSKASLIRRLRIALKFPIYLTWLNKEVLFATIEVMYYAFHPRMKSLIDPQFIRFKSTLPDYAQYILASSITLTPGTVTVDLQKNEFLVHALTASQAEGCPGAMSDKVRHFLK